MTESTEKALQSKVDNDSQQFIDLLTNEAKEKIYEIEQRSVTDFEQELEKRQEIVAVVSKKSDKIRTFFSSKGYTENDVQVILDSLNEEIAFYQEDVQLVEEQINKIREIDNREDELEVNRNRAFLEASMLRQSQSLYTTLDKNIKASYQSVLEEGHIEEIDFSVVVQKQQTLKQREIQIKNNLELANQSKEAVGYRTVYQKLLVQNKMEQNQVNEQYFLYFLNKLKNYPVHSYEDLWKRTRSIHTLLNTRKREVRQLQEQGFIPKDYSTLASKISHEDLIRELSNAYKLEQLEVEIQKYDSSLPLSRSHIMEIEALEQHFKEKATKAGKAFEPSKKIEDSIETNAETELVFTDDGYEAYEVLSEEEVEKDKSTRRKVVMAKPANSVLLKKVLSLRVKKVLLAALATVTIFSSCAGMLHQVEAFEETDSISQELEEAKESLSGTQKSVSLEAVETEEDIKYQPSIGDEIHLNEGSTIYSTSMNAVNGVSGYDVHKNGLDQSNLYVTRGAIIDHTGTLVYVTTEYGVDLNEVAQNMGLKDYKIALGCSSGDTNGNFMAVPDNILSNIEKGWIDSDETYMTIKNQLNKQLEGGKSL